MRKNISIVLTLLTSLLLLCGCTKTIEFSAAEVRSDVQELSIVLQAGETALLDNLPELKSVDFSGSECYEEIFLWAQEHPDVDVLYTLSLPDKSTVNNNSKLLKLSGHDSAYLEQVMELTKFLPQLESVEFPKSDPISPELFSELSGEYPQYSFSASFDINGQLFSTNAYKLNMTGISAEDAEKLCLVLPALTKLERVELGNQESSTELSFGLISAMQKACPSAEFNYSFTLYDQTFTTADTKMDFRGVRMYDNGAAVMEALSCMPKMEYLDMDSCRVSDEDMVKIRDAYPDVTVVWRVWFGENYCVRTDVEKILASMPSAGGELVVENSQALKYCTKVKYLDLGHNEYLKDISFVNYMPDLEVAIFAMTAITDISCLENCPKLEFLEIQTTKLSDISPLSGMKNLRHLNICYLYELDDISPIMDLELERLWIGDLSPVPQEQIDEYQRLHPNCRISTTNRDPHENGWRYDQDKDGAWGMHPRYKILVDQFGYDKHAYAFYWKDPLYLR